MKIITTELGEHSEVIYGSERWLACIGYCVLSFANTLGYVSYSPIWNYAANYYNIDPYDLQWLTNMYYLTYIFFSPFMIKPLLLRFDLSMYACAIITSSGTWLIWIGGNSFNLSLVGYALVGISQSILLAVPVYFSDLYFNVYERTLITCITSYANLGGLLFQYTFSTFYFYQMEDQQQINSKIESMNLIIAIMNTSGLILTFAFIRRKEREVNLDEEKLIQQIKRTFSNQEQLFNIISFSSFIALGWSYSQLLSLQLFNYGFTQSDVGITGMVYNLGGIVIGIWAGYRLDKHVSKGIQPNYDIYIKVATVIGFVCQIIQAFLVQHFNFVVLEIFSFFIGVGLNSIYPLVMCSLCEKYYPMSSLWLITFLLQLANIIGFINNFIIVIPAFLPYSFWIGLLIITPFQLYLILFYKTKYNKFELIQT